MKRKRPGGAGQQEERDEKARLHTLALKIQRIDLERAGRNGKVDSDSERAFNMAEKVRDRHEGRPIQRTEASIQGSITITAVMIKEAEEQYAEWLSTQKSKSK